MGAMSRLKGLGPLPLIEQPHDMVNWLTMVAQQPQIDVRKTGFKVAVELLLCGCCWKAQSLKASMELLLEDFHDLCADVPGLKSILTDELLVELGPLVKSGAVSKLRYSAWHQAVSHLSSRCPTTPPPQSCLAFRTPRNPSSPTPPHHPHVH